MFEEGVDGRRAPRTLLSHTRAESPSAGRLGGAAKRPDESTASQAPRPQSEQSKSSVALLFDLSNRFLEFKGVDSGEFGVVEFFGDAFKS